MEQITAFKCSFCRKLYHRERDAKRHESVCKVNPENKRPCFSCKHLTKKDFTVEWASGKERVVSLLFCKKKNESLLTPQVVIKGNALQTEDGSIPMPVECHEFADASIVVDFNF